MKVGVREGSREERKKGEVGRWWEVRIHETYPVPFQWFSSVTVQRYQHSDC